jgi:hypothetical protein
LTSNRKTTLLLVKGSRPVSSFTVPGCLGGLILLLLVASVTLALLLYYGYFGLQDQIAELRTQTRQLNKKVSSLRTAPKPVLGLTPPPAPPPVKPKPKPKPPPKLVKVVKKPPEPIKKKPPPEKPKPPPAPVKPKRILTEKKDWPLMVVDDVNLTPNSRGLRVRFDLKSAKPGAEQLEGYFFVLGVDTSADPPRVAGHSNFKLNKNLPENYKRGMSFSFKYQKPTNSVTIRYPSGVKKFNRIYIVIYDKGGKLRVIKSVDVPKK